MRVLHAGCGIDRLPEWLGPCEEVRLDIDARVAPDIVASMLDIGEVGLFDAVYCCHALEHLYPHEVGRALAEFRRVLRPGGTLVLFVPDLEDVRPTEDVLYVSPSGPITGLDLFYGFRPGLEAFPHMAHHTGFTSATISAALESAGFINIQAQRLEHHNLLAGAKKEG